MTRKGLLIATTVALLVPAQVRVARAADCPTLLHLHGYLTVAVVKCGYKKAAAIINAASACRAQAGHAAATKTATDGIRFAIGEIVVKGGVPAWCSFVKGQYPSVIGAPRAR
ncbi:MAG: hypothetical protein ACHQAY_17670 [Hyphomicrobiales bacterium]